MFLILVILLLGLAVPSEAMAQRETTRAALDHLEEVVAMRQEEGVLKQKNIVPLIVVSVAPMFQESEKWYPTAALATLTRVFGPDAIRLCEACAVPRTFVERGHIEQSTGIITIPEIQRLDESLRGSAPPARAALWLEESEAGVSLRVVDLLTSRILVAENIDPWLEERATTAKNFSLARELTRRQRGESITQTFVDMAVYPGQHFSLDWTEQWGETNANLSGFSLSLFDPVVGVGGAYYRAVPEAFNLLVGVKVLMSVPTAMVRSFGEEDAELIDRLLTGVFILRVPIARSNYGFVLSASTNGRIGVGISLMNMSLLPVLP